MTKTIIELVKDQSGKLQYAVVKSGDSDLDKLADVAVGTMGMYVKSGGNINNLIGSMGADAQNSLKSMLGGIGGSMNKLFNF